jgi:ArsR family transcriptional regulator, arsenate/arsenite/antimonite-responsive transcriptional repressor
MVGNKSSKVDRAILASVADYFKVLSEVSRLEILNSLNSEPMSVMEIAESTGLGQANLSKHLKILTQAGMLTRQQRGTSAYYEIADPMIFELCALVYRRLGDRVSQQAESFAKYKASETEPEA